MGIFNGIFMQKPNIEELEQNRDVEGLIRALKYKKDTDVLNEAVKDMEKARCRRSPS